MVMMVAVMMAAVADVSFHEFPDFLSQYENRTFHLRWSVRPTIKFDTWTNRIVELNITHLVK